MFRSTARSLRSWWGDFSEDILGADLPPSVYDEDGTTEVEDEAATLAHHRLHPHRQALVSTLPRRSGSVPARPGHCLSPVRSSEPAIPRASTPR